MWAGKWLREGLNLIAEAGQDSELQGWRGFSSPAHLVWLQVGLRCVFVLCTSLCSPEE